MSYHWRSWIAVSVFFFSLSLFIGCTAGELLTVCEDGCGFSTIKAAIDAANPGDIVKVQSGIYKENVRINKSLTLIGEDTGTAMPIIDAGGNGNAVIVLADGVTVEGFNLTNAFDRRMGISAGIKVLANNSVLKNNLAFYNANGIYLRNSLNCSLENNYLLTNKYYGIFVETSHNTTIAENEMRDNNYGLLMLSSSDNLLRSNIAEDNNFGIKLDNSENNTLIDNQMMRNNYNFGAEGHNNVSIGNLVDSRPILYLLGVSNRTIDSSTEAGTIYCLDCQNVTVRGLNLSNNFYGIYMDNSTGSLVEQNNLRNGYVGIALNESHDNLVKANLIGENMVDGIALVDSDYNSIESNRLENNGRGIFLLKTSHNDINNNSIVDSNRRYIGIYLDSSLGNRLIENMIYGHYYGLRITSSLLNDITRNNISNNSIGIYRIEYENNTLNNTMLNNSEDEKVYPKPTAGANFVVKKPINIDSIPEKADIWIDGKPKGLKTPYEVELDSGRYELEIKLDKMKARRTIIVRDEPQDVVINLTKR